MTTAGVHRLSLVARLTQVVQGRPRHDEQVDELLAAHADAVYRYAFRLTRNADAAQDLMQETLLRGWQARGKLRVAAAARVWLLRITTNVHRDQCRAARPTEPFVAELPDPAAPVAGRWDERECVERALAALDELPPRQRQVMHLITIEQLTQEQTAEVLEITVNAVKSSLSQARRQMRERLKDVYDELRGVPAQDL